MNIRQYVKRNRIAVEVTDGPRVQKDEQGWEHRAYTLRLVWQDGALSRKWEGVKWHQGMGITAEPTDEPWNVLDSLASDAASYLDARDFEDWAESLGYDTDSRRAERMYRECGDAAKRLEAFVGSRQEMERLLYRVERD